MLIPRSIVRLASICDRDSTRYALGGVLLTRQPDGQPLALACDGRRLVVESWAEPKPADYRKLATTVEPVALEHVAGYQTIVRAKDLESANKLPAPRNKFAASEKGQLLGHLVVKEIGTNGHVEISATDGERAGQQSAATLEGRFPRWQDVVPDYSGAGGISVTLNARLLAEMLTAISAHAGNENDEIVISLAADDPHAKPIAVSAARADGNVAFGVLMPLNRANDKPEPAWVPNRKIATPAAKPETKPAAAAPASEPEAKPTDSPAKPASPPDSPVVTRARRPRTEPAAAETTPATTADSGDWRDLARRFGY